MQAAQVQLSVRLGRRAESGSAASKPPVEWATGSLYGMSRAKRMRSRLELQPVRRRSQSQVARAAESAPAVKDLEQARPFLGIQLRRLRPRGQLERAFGRAQRAESAPVIGVGQEPQQWS
jgi:hypothetical protein